jgi:hypothetical protein
MFLINIHSNLIMAGMDQQEEDDENAEQQLVSMLKL